MLRGILKKARSDLRRKKYDAVHGGPVYPQTSAELLGETRADPLKYFSEDAKNTMAGWKNAGVDALIVKHRKEVLSMRF